MKWSNQAAEPLRMRKTTASYKHVVSWSLLWCFSFFLLSMDDLLLLDLSFNRFLSFELCETFFSGLCDRWGGLIPILKG